MSDQEKTRLWERLRRNRDRLQKIADWEAQGAILGSGAAGRRLDPQREDLINEACKILDKLEKCYKPKPNS